MQLKRIGYWRAVEGDGYPDPVDWIRGNADEDERASIVGYLRSGFLARAYVGVSNCRLCGLAVGSGELTDGVYLWPEGLAHYIDEHYVRLPEPLVDYFVETQAAYETASADDTSWRGYRPAV